jgi:hypothetical protein
MASRIKFHMGQRHRRELWRYAIKIMVESRLS